MRIDPLAPEEDIESYFGKIETPDPKEFKAICEYAGHCKARRGTEKEEECDLDAPADPWWKWRKENPDDDEEDDAETEEKTTT